MKALRYCTALYGFGDLFSCGHATPSHGIQPACSWDVQRRQTAHPLECRFWVKNGIVPACAACPFRVKNRLKPRRFDVRSSLNRGLHQGDVRSAKCRQQRTSRTTSRRRSGKPALIFRCFQIDDMGSGPCVNFLGEQSTRSANAKP